MGEKLNKLFKRTLKPIRLPRDCKELDCGSMLWHAASNVGIRPVTYQFPRRIYEFSKSLDEEIDTFLTSVDCDRYNENYFDPVINITCNLGITDIDRQAQAHKRACLGIREIQNVELGRLRLKKQELEEQIMKNEQEEAYVPEHT